jgi:hypothetical protein
MRIFHAVFSTVWAGSLAFIQQNTFLAPER